MTWSFSEFETTRKLESITEKETRDEREQRYYRNIFKRGNNNYYN
jgi:hypothetical protein